MENPAWPQVSAIYRPHPFRTDVPEIKSTPRSGKPSSRQQFSAKQDTVSELRLALGDEMAERVFEIPVEKFMDEFIPERNWTLPRKETGKWKSKFKDVDQITKESLMYPGFCEAVNLVLNKFRGNCLVARDTADWGDKTEDWAKLMGPSSVVRPDVSIYRNTPEAVRDYELTAADVEGSKCAKDRHRHLARVCWQRLCIPIELKIDHTLSAFEFLKPEKKSPVRSVNAMGQIADYASKVLLAQHREFCLMVYVFKFLATFIYRVGHMSHAQLGYDPTVVAATPAEVSLMASCRGRLNDYHQQCLAEAMSPKWPIYKVAFYAKDLVDSEALRMDARSAGQSMPTFNSTPQSPSDSPSLDDSAALPSEASNSSLHPDDISTSEPVRYFLIGRPRFAAHSPTGRATRGYVAYDMETEGWVPKDTWRPDSSKIHPEREVYERLYKHDVSNIATLLCGGDRTRTQEFGGSFWSDPLPAGVKEVGRPLDDHEDSEEMIGVIYWRLMLTVKLGRSSCTHRDAIKGFLNDWDLCKYEDELDGAYPEDAFREFDYTELVSVWADAALPGNVAIHVSITTSIPEKTLRSLDDLESFMHVVNWLALKWYRHSLRTDDHCRNISLIPMISGPVSMATTWGEPKLQQIRIGEVPFILSIRDSAYEWVTDKVDNQFASFAPVRNSVSVGSRESKGKSCNSLLGERPKRARKTPSTHTRSIETRSMRRMVDSGLGSGLGSVLPSVPEEGSRGCGFCGGPGIKVRRMFRKFGAGILIHLASLLLLALILTYASLLSCPGNLHVVQLPGMNIYWVLFESNRARC
ncbi:hypothetical protein BKA93DRAFT_752435 [Sparassis latifolia]